MLAPMFAAEVFETIADRLSERADDIVMFAETGEPFEPWCRLESYAACRDAEWIVRLSPPYSEVGITGSRDHADLLVFDPAGGGRAMVELSTVFDWATTSWIAELDRDTHRLERPLANGTAPLQLVLAVSPDSALEVNPTWKSWLGMTSIWPRPSKLKRVTPVGSAGEMVLRGWLVQK
ncbi:MAG: hypothetical protein ACYTG1_07220 [Planctomycetota bacterium]|jgi:hypothetical protein